MLEGRTCFYWLIETNEVRRLNTFNSTVYFNSIYNLRRGRFIFLGAGSSGDGLLAYNASRNSVEGTACALREELKPYGVSVVTLESSGVPAESLFKSPIPFSKTSIIKLDTLLIALVFFSSNFRY